MKRNSVGASRPAVNLDDQRIAFAALVADRFDEDAARPFPVARISMQNSSFSPSAKLLTCGLASVRLFPAARLPT